MRETRIHAFGAVIAALLVVLAAANAGQGRSAWQSEFTGHFMATVACHIDEGFSVTHYTLTLDDSREFKLIVPDEHALPEPGATATVVGRLVGDTIRVDQIAQIESPRTHAQTTGEQRMIVALVNFQNDTTENVTVQQVETRLFDPNYSVDQYWREASFGKTWASGDVVGWITLPINRQCNANLVRTHTINALDQMVNLTQYNRLVILIPGAGGCSWAGLGTLGHSTVQTSHGPWQTTTSWCRSEYYNETLHHPRRAIFLTAHEIGHNFGRHHARSITWSSPVRSLGPFDCAACQSTIAEYGDQHCTLGGSWRTPHYNAMHKIGLGWFEPENVLNVDRTGIYEIDAYALASNEPKVLRIHRGFGPSTNRNEWLFAEWRQPIGYDADVNYSGGVSYNGILIHYEYGHSQTASWMLDMTPGDNNMENARLPNNTTWNDLFTNLSLRPLGPSGGKMRVQVTIGEPLPTTSFEVLTGQLVSGGLTEIQESNDNYMVLQTAPLPAAGLPVMSVEFKTFVNPMAAPQAFRFELEGHAQMQLNQRIEMWNFTTNQWALVDSRTSTPSDSYVVVNVWTNPWRYFDSVTGEMRTRVRFFQTMPVLFTPYQARIDQAVWKVLR